MNTYGSLISELEDAISRGSVERRLETLWHVTDLFILGSETYADDQTALFDDVIGRLAAEIEVTARAKLARRLAPVPTAPVNVIKSLALDDCIEVAGPVLKESERLDDETLIDGARAKSQQHLLAIAGRGKLSEAVTDILVTRGDRDVVHSVTRNRGARFSDSGFSVLVKRSDGDDLLAEHVGLRQDVPRHHLLKLITKASDNVRRKLAAANPDATSLIQEVLAEVVGRIQAESVASSRDFAAAKQTVEALQRNGQLDETAVYGFAKTRRFEETAVALAWLSGLPVDAVERAMLEERPEITLILAKSIRLSWTTTKALLLLRASNRGVSAHDLEQALKSFERLQAETAQRVVRFYLARQRISEETA